MQTVHPSLLERKIIHFDMDAFYAAVEMRDDPRLRGRPVVVGGPPSSRAVVCTASYEARRYGIRSAMPCSQAQRLCPQAVFVKPDFPRYAAVSRQLQAIYLRFTGTVEPLSLDEAYLDVTDSATGMYAVRIAKLMRQAVADELSLTGSAGVGPNKLIAKLASDLRKPNGLTVILPDAVAGFMSGLPLRKIHGIGPATERLLAAAGLFTCSDAQKKDLEDLIVLFGARTASWLYDRCRGIDTRPVQPVRERKSLGQETTFSRDLDDMDSVLAALAGLARKASDALAHRRLLSKTVTVKVKYSDFQLATRSLSLDAPTASPQIIMEAARQMLDRTEAGKRKVRLLGISLSKLTPAAQRQAEQMSAELRFTEPEYHPIA